MVIPAAIDDIDVAWLQAVLKENAVVGADKLCEVRAEPISQGRGFTAQVFRLHLDYLGDDGAGPSSLAVKLHAPESAKAEQIRLVYANEHRFYDQLAERSPIGTPHCYFVDYDEESSRFILVMEDLSDRQGCDQIKGAPDDLIRQSIRNLACHHATFWNDKTIGKLVAPMEESTPDAADILPMAKKVVNAVKREFPDPLLHAIADLIYEGVSQPGLKPQEQKRPNPFTLVHSDYRLDNMFFDDGRQIVIDWGAAVGAPAQDLGFFLAGSLTLEQQRLLPELLSLYHKTLIDEGIEKYSLRKLRNDVRSQVVGMTIGMTLLRGFRRAREHETTQREFEQLVPLGFRQFIEGVLDDERGGLLMDSMLERSQGMFRLLVPRRSAFALVLVIRGVLRTRRAWVNWRRRG